MPPSSAGPLAWHPSFRYFRLSHTTGDLFDAYRNLYLALEAILSDIAPQGKEGEGVWVKRALGEAAKVVPFAELVPAGPANPVDLMFQVLYLDVRSPISHAKAGRTVLIPADPAERTLVIDALRLGADLYLRLVEQHLGVRRLGGFVTSLAFTSMGGALLDGATACISDDEAAIDPNATDVAPNGGRVVCSTTAGPIDTSTPFVTRRTWTLAPADLDPLDVVRRLVSAVNGQPMLTNRLEGDLILGKDVSELRLTFSYRGSNIGVPRVDYPF